MKRPAEAQLMGWRLPKPPQRQNPVPDHYVDLMHLNDQRYLDRRASTGRTPLGISIRIDGACFKNRWEKVFSGILDI